MFHELQLLSSTEYLTKTKCGRAKEQVAPHIKVKPRNYKAKITLPLFYDFFRTHQNAESCRPIIFINSLDFFLSLVTLRDIKYTNEEK